MKKYLALALAAVMVLGATACSKKEEPAAETPAAETPATGDGETFVIGGIGPLTGGAASYGISVKQGAEVAIKEINEAGGVTVGETTYQLAMNFADDEATPDKAITAYNTLMDAGVNAIMGAVTSGACMAITGLTAEDGILQITPSGSAQGCTEFDNAFRICFTDPMQGISMAEFIKNDLALTKVAVVFNNSDEYSSGMKDAFLEKAAELGLEVVATEAFNEGDVDFSTQLTKIKGTDAEIIFAPIYYEAAAYLTQQAFDAGMALPFVGGDGWDGVLAQVTDPATVEGAIFLSPFLATDPAVANFVTAYEGAYSATPDQFAADGYDAVYTIKAAMETAGTIESADLIAAMTEIEIAGTTGTFTFTADGEPAKSAKFIKIIDGAYTAY